MIDIQEFKQRFPRMFRKLDYIEAPKGWKDLIEHMCLDIIKYEAFFSQQHLYQPFAFEQIKQKFGALRVYYLGGAEGHPAKPISDTVRAYEDASTKICCVCGSTDVRPMRMGRTIWGSPSCKDCIK